MNSCLLLSLVSIVILCTATEIESRQQFYRIKRDGGLLESLGQVIQQLKDTFLGPPKQGALNDAFVPNSKLPAEYKGPTILQAIGFCKINLVDCDFVSCLATNFKNSKMAQGVKKGGKVLLDPPLRRALLDDPNIMKAACETQELNDFMCNAFKQFLGLFDKIDPPSAHVHDEPRDKRSAELPVRHDALPVVAVVNPAPGSVVVVRDRPSAFLAAPVPKFADPVNVPAQRAAANSAAAVAAPPPQPAQQSMQSAPKSAQSAPQSAQPAPPRGDGFPPQRQQHDRSKETGGGGGHHGASDYDYSTDHGGKSAPGGGSTGGGGGGGGGSDSGKPGHDDYYGHEETHSSGHGEGGSIGEGPQRNCIAERQSAVTQRNAAQGPG